VPLTPMLSLIAATDAMAPYSVTAPGSSEMPSFTDLVLSLKPAVPNGADEPRVVALAALDYAHIVVICGYALTVAMLLPGLKARSKTLRSYSGRAASAMSRIRCTMARSPFER